MDDIDLDFKVVVLGGTDVGKTSLSVRYVEGSFLTPTTATVGASFLQKRTEMNGQRVTLQIWDTAGQERFRSMAPMYYRNAVAAILVFDLSKESSFEQMMDFYTELMKHTAPDIVLAIAGNKADIAGANMFDFAKAERYAKKIGAVAFKTSAKTGEGVEEVFNSICERSVRLLKQQSDRKISHVDSSGTVKQPLRVNNKNAARQTGRSCC